MQAPPSQAARGANPSWTMHLTNRCQSLGQRSDDHIGFADGLPIDRHTRGRFGATQLPQRCERLRIVTDVLDLQAACMQIVDRNLDPARKTAGILQVEDGVCAQALWRGCVFGRCRTFGVDALAERGEFRNVAFAGRSDRGGVANRAPTIDQDGGAIRNSGSRQIGAIGVGHRPFGLKIGQQREGDTSQIAGPVGMAMNTIDTDTQNLGVCGLEARQKSLDPGHFLTSGGCPIEWIEGE